MMGHQELSYEDIRDKKIKYRDITYKVVINPSYEWLGYVENSGVSHRELEVLALTLEGYKKEEIADVLQIKEQSIKNHMYNLKKKLGAKNSSQVVLIAISMNLIKWILISDDFKVEIEAESFMGDHKLLLGGRDRVTIGRLEHRKELEEYEKGAETYYHEIDFKEKGEREKE